MIDAIAGFFTNIYDAVSGIIENITMFFKTVVLIPSIAPWFTALVPTIFVPALALGVTFVVVKIIKDLL